MANLSSFKPAYCNEAIQCLALGHSIAGFAGQIGVAVSTVYDWVKRHPDFASSMQIATAKAVFYWEQRLIECAETGKGNVTAIIFGLKNRAHEEWRDVQKIEHGRPGDFSGMTDEELDELIASGQRAAGAGRRREEEAGGKEASTRSRRLN